MMQRELIPFGRQQSFKPGLRRDFDYSPLASVRRDYDWSPFASFRRDMDQLFSDFFRMPEFGGYGYAGQAGNWPILDLKEADSEVIVTAEVPGLTDKDVELYFDDGILTIRGEKKREEERGYSERYHGRFERQVALPYSVDGEHCAAEFQDGLLTIRFPKLAEAENKKKIPINAGTRH
jgi:HSP20 family protein